MIRPNAILSQASIRSRRFRGRGFTLVEVLATLLLVGIVLPTVMQGIELSGRAADLARHNAEASGLAEGQLARLMADGSWQNGTSGGDFSPEWPNYRWESNVVNWGDGSVQELDLRVIWMSRGREESLTLATLVYARATQ